MSEKQAPNGKEPDSADPFREMRDTYLDAWSKTMVDTVNSDAYAKASGMMLNSYLSTSSPFREAVEKVMLQALQQSQPRLALPEQQQFGVVIETALLLFLTEHCDLTIECSNPEITVMLFPAGEPPMQPR